MPTKARIVGSGYTLFTYEGAPLAFAETIADSGEELVNAAPELVHPINMPYPFEVCSCEATRGGTLTITIRELWNYEVWENLFPDKVPAGKITIRDIVNHEEITLSKIIQMPDGTGNKTIVRGKVFHGCRVTAVQTGENITVGQITIPKTVTLTYTHCSSLTT